MQLKQEEQDLPCIMHLPLVILSQEHLLLFMRTLGLLELISTLGLLLTTSIRKSSEMIVSSMK
jgi:hypothetical protein